MREVNLTNKDGHFLVFVTYGRSIHIVRVEEGSRGNTTRHIGQSLACDASIRGPTRLSSITLTQQGGFFLGCLVVGVYSTCGREEEGAGAAHTTHTS